MNGLESISKIEVNPSATVQLEAISQPEATSKSQTSAIDYFERLRNGDLDFRARQEAVDWIEKAHSHFNFRPLCPYLSAYELPTGKEWMMQLLAITCLSLAAKMEETEVPLCLNLQKEIETGGKHLCSVVYGSLPPLTRTRQWLSFGNDATTHLDFVSEMASSETRSEDDGHLDPSEDDFFLIGSSSDEADVDDEWTDKSTREQASSTSGKAASGMSSDEKTQRQLPARALMPPPGPSKRLILANVKPRFEGSSSKKPFTRRPEDFAMSNSMSGSSF